MAGYGYAEVDSHGESALLGFFAFFSFTDEMTGKTEDIGVSAKSDLIIGRSPEQSDYQISDKLVSKKHFRITSIVYEQGKEKEYPPLVYCEDLGSSNGTFVNNKLIGIVGEECQSHLLIDGDVIDIPPFWKFEFHQFTPEARPWDEGEEYDFDYFRDRYKVHDRVLGRGQHGSVYLAEDVEHNKQIACKIVKLQRRKASYDADDFDAGMTQDRDNLWSSQEGRQDTLREIKILSQLDHPHIINVQNAFCSRTKLYIFTDLAAGGDLFSYIDSHGGNLDDPLSRVISLQIVMAIEYMHSKQIAHRDIKPENVLIKETEFGGRVMLTDFGYARELDTKTRRMKSMLGTRGYVAPEIGKQEPGSEEGYTMAVDLWSLGILTRCMLIGHRDITEEYFSQVNLPDIAQLGDRIEDEILRELWMSISSLAKKFLGRLLVVDPSQRMTATEARTHSWFTKPRSEASLIEDRYHEIIRFWEKRGNSDRVIQKLPNTEVPESQKRLGPRFRRKLPDASAHHPMNVDRHLYQRDRLDRQALVDTLNQNGTQSGSWFVASSSTETRSRFFERSPDPLSDVQIESASGSDIFGTSQKSNNSLQPDQLSCSQDEAKEKTQAESSMEILLDDGEIDESDSTMAEELVFNVGEQRLAFEDQYTLWQVDEQNNQQDSDDHAPEGNIPRTGSWDLEDRRLHSSVSKKLQPFTSAKAFRDAIAKERSGDDEIFNEASTNV